jgi:NADH:ubiquinone oxidoreductase subunit K
VRDLDIQRTRSRPVRLVPLAAVTLANYAAQVPYFIHNDFSVDHPLPGVRAAGLLGVTLAWFILGLAGFLRGRRWGFAVLVSFLAAEALFYGATFATGIFLLQMHHHSGLLRAVFVTGYASGAVAVWYACSLIWHRARAGSRPGRARQVGTRAAEAGPWRP